MFRLGGNPGSGKSTIARRLAHELDLPLHPVDAYTYDHVQRLGGPRSSARRGPGPWARRGGPGVRARLGPASADRARRRPPGGGRPGAHARRGAAAAPARAHGGDPGGLGLAPRHARTHPSSPRRAGSDRERRHPQPARPAGRARPGHRRAARAGGGSAGAAGRPGSVRRQVGRGRHRGPRGRPDRPAVDHGFDLGPSWPPADVTRTTWCTARSRPTRGTSAPPCLPSPMPARAGAAAVPTSSRPPPTTTDAARMASVGRTDATGSRVRRHRRPRGPRAPVAR